MTCQRIYIDWIGVLATVRDGRVVPPPEAPFLLQALDALGYELVVVEPVLTPTEVFLYLDEWDLIEWVARVQARAPRLSDFVTMRRLFDQDGANAFHALVKRYRDQEGNVQ